MKKLKSKSLIALWLLGIVCFVVAIVIMIVLVVYSCTSTNFNTDTTIKLKYDTIKQENSGKTIE